MPTIDQATFTHRAGEILQPGAVVFATVPVLNLLGSFIRVEVTDLGIDWTGYIVDDATARESAFDDGGTMKLKQETPDFVAVGLEWFLGRRQVDSSVFYKDGAATTRVFRAVGYNTGSGDYREPVLGLRGNKDQRLTAASFTFAADSDNAEQWTALEMIDNLLFYHGPVDNLGAFSPLEYKLDVATSGPFVDRLALTVPTEGRTVLQVLNQIIDPGRGLTWWVDYSDGDPSITIKISSSSPNIVILPGGGTIPAALTQATYDFDVDVAVKKARVAHAGTREYDVVKVRGARRTSTCTLSIADGNLEESWLSAEETAYIDAGAAVVASKADRFRNQNRFERVYQSFRIPEAWDGKSQDGTGIGGAHEFVSPVLLPGSITILGGEPFHLRGLRLLRTTPLRAGYNWTSALAPVSNTPAKTPAEFLKPFGAVKHDGKYTFMDRASRHIDEDEATSKALKTSYRMTTVSEVPGVEVRASAKLPHALALNHFDTATPAPSETEAEVDFDDMLVTVCIEWDSYCEGVWPIPVGAAAPVQELVVYLDGNRIRLDWLALHTVWDVDEAGALKTVTTGGPIQDDRRRCEDLARTAFEWYKTPRATLDIQYHNLQELLALGTLITKIGTPGEAYEQTVNSVVTQWTHNLEAGKTTLSAGFKELNLSGLV